VSSNDDAGAHGAIGVPTGIAPAGALPQAARDSSVVSHEETLAEFSMPGMSGHELIQAVRARPEGVAPLALACSGYSRAQDEKRALEAGFDALIGKPATLEQGERVIARLRRQACRRQRVDVALTFPPGAPVALVAACRDR